MFVDADRQAHGFSPPHHDMAVNDSEESLVSDVEHNESEEVYEGSEYYEDEDGFYSDDEAWDAAVEDEEVSFIFISIWT